MHLQLLTSEASEESPLVSSSVDHHMDCAIQSSAGSQVHRQAVLLNADGVAVLAYSGLTKLNTLSASDRTETSPT